MKTKTKKLFLSEEFKTSADELYETFVDKQVQWRGSVEIIAYDQFVWFLV